MELYYVETDFGCGIRIAMSEEHAWKNLLRDEGANHAICVRLATKQDIAHVELLGGYIPNISAKQAKPAKRATS